MGDMGYSKVNILGNSYFVTLSLIWLVLLIILESEIKYLF